MLSSASPIALSRRRVLLASGASLALAHVPRPLRAATPEQPVDLEPQPSEAQLLPKEQPPTAVWSYNGQVPGPILRLPQGARLDVRLINRLPQPTTVHWHGIRIDNAMDGVAGLTQAAVPPGERFDYSFTVPDAGTYWYHPHNRSWEQVARGLSGLLIVGEKDPPAVDQDLVLVVDDWRLGENGAIDRYTTPQPTTESLSPTLAGTPPFEARLARRP